MRNISLALVLAVLLFGVGCDDEKQPRGRAKPPEFSKSELSRFASGKTKAEIREALGQPSSVVDQGDTWLYVSNGPLKVYDPDAQVRVSAWVRFDHSTGTVLSVTFP